MSLSPRANLPILNQISCYSLTEKVYEDNISSIFTAINKYTQSQCTAIIYSKDLSYYSIANIHREIFNLKMLKHKNILSLYEVFETKAHICLFTELRTGKELFEHITQRKRLSEKEALPIFQQLIDAVKYSHKMTMAHRDIRPESILIDCKGGIKLINFGSSILYAKGQLIQDFREINAYSCPEMIEKKGYLGVKCDVWSCGVLLYAMICGFLPFCEEDDERNKEVIVKGDFLFPEKGISDLVKDLIKNMLEVDPMKRYDFYQIVAHPWFNSNKMSLVDGLNVLEYKYPIDKRLMQFCNAYDFDTEKITQELMNNNMTHGTAVYMLCLKMVTDFGKMSCSDLCSKEFTKYLEVQKNQYTVSVAKKRYEDMVEGYKKIMEMIQKEKEDLAKKEEEALAELQKLSDEHATVEKEADADVFSVVIKNKRSQTFSYKFKPSLALILKEKETKLKQSNFLRRNAKINTEGLRQAIKLFEEFKNESPFCNKDSSDSDSDSNISSASEGVSNEANDNKEEESKVDSTNEKDYELFLPYKEENNRNNRMIQAMKTISEGDLGSEEDGGSSLRKRKEDGITKEEATVDKVIRPFDVNENDLQLELYTERITYKEMTLLDSHSLKQQEVIPALIESKPIIDACTERQSEVVDIELNANIEVNPALPLLVEDLIEKKEAIEVETAIEEVSRPNEESYNTEQLVKEHKEELLQPEEIFSNNEHQIKEPVINSHLESIEIKDQQEENGYQPILHSSRDNEAVHEKEEHHKLSESIKEISISGPSEIQPITSLLEASSNAVISQAAIEEEVSQPTKETIAKSFSPLLSSNEKKLAAIQTNETPIKHLTLNYRDNHHNCNASNEEEEEKEEEDKSRNETSNAKRSDIPSSRSSVSSKSKENINTQANEDRLITQRASNKSDIKPSIKKQITTNSPSMRNKPKQKLEFNMEELTSQFFTKQNKTSKPSRANSKKKKGIPKPFLTRLTSKDKSSAISKRQQPTNQSNGVELYPATPKTKTTPLPTSNTTVKPGIKKATTTHKLGSSTKTSDKAKPININKDKEKKVKAKTTLYTQQSTPTKPKPNSKQLGMAQNGKGSTKTLIANTPFLMANDDDSKQDYQDCINAHKENTKKITPHKTVGLLTTRDKDKENSKESQLKDILMMRISEKNDQIVQSKPIKEKKAVMKPLIMLNSKAVVIPASEKKPKGIKAKHKAKHPDKTAPKQQKDLRLGGRVKRQNASMEKCHYLSTESTAGKMVYEDTIESTGRTIHQNLMNYFTTRSINEEHDIRKPSRLQSSIDTGVMNTNKSVSSIAIVTTTSITIKGNAKKLRIEEPHPPLYSGPIDIVCIASSSLNGTINYLLLKLKDKLVIYSQNSKLSYSCWKNDLSFEVNIVELATSHSSSKKLFYYLIKAEEGSQEQFASISSLFAD